MNNSTETTQMNSIRGSSGMLYIDDAGGGEHLPVVFVHSFAGSTRDWKNQLEFLRNERRAIAFDLRGHGQSDAPADNDYQVRSLANDLEAVVDSLRLDRFILVGHSIGGSAAIAYAGKHPENVAGLLVTGTPGKSPAEQAKQIIASLESEKYDTVMAQYMDRLLKDATEETGKMEREGISKIPKPAALSLIRAAFNYDPLPDMHKYPGPELIVSKSSEEQPHSLHNSLPNVPFKSIEGTSHWIHLDKPHEFNKILKEFIERVEKK
jgi:pimeloyl-ACP methyl ester carboxylesterase